MSDKKTDADIDRQWDNRVLCSDESCIGTIGVNGCCTECGRPFEGVLPAGFHDVQANPEPLPIVVAEADTRDANGIIEPRPEDEAQGADPDDAWERRTLCIDESCIGVVDEATGCCKECGKPYHKA
jgi:hypothetical protein